MIDKFVSEEVNSIVNDFTECSSYKDSNILITGGTGFIGSYLVRVLAKLNRKYSLNIKVFSTARSIDKVKSLGLENDAIWIFKSLNEKLSIDDNIDYIIHTVSPTDSSYFTNNPVETINNTIIWLNSLMQLAIEKKVKGFLFTSSLEVYGICNDDRLLKENEYYSVDCNNVRSSYSEGKKILECLCCSYASEYDVPVKIVRLGQTFGPGILKDDNRVFAQFARAVSLKQNIVLNTKGETKRSYCSISDAIRGMLIVLLNGKKGESYNLASDNSYISIYELAKLFIDGTNSKIIIEEKECKQYLGVIKYGLDTQKIKEIGFKSVKSIVDVVGVFKLYFNNII